MARIKRTSVDRARDAREIAHLHLTERLTQAEIAERLNARTDVSYTLSPRQVGYDLQKMTSEWRLGARLDINTAKQRELARLDDLEREHWQAWSKVAPDKQTAPKYLAGVLSCIQRRCKILGLDAPLRQEVTGADGAPLSLIIVEQIVSGHSDADDDDSPAPDASGVSPQ